MLTGTGAGRGAGGAGQGRVYVQAREVRSKVGMISGPKGLQLTYCTRPTRTVLLMQLYDAQYRQNRSFSSARAGNVSHSSLTK